MKNMIKKMFVAAALAAFTLTSCSEAKQETTAGTENMANHDNMAAGSKAVVEAPDYSSVTGPVKEQLAAMLDSYLKLKDALVDANPQEAKAQAQAVVAAAGKVDVTALTAEQKAFATEELEQVKQNAASIAQGADADAQRANLEPLSEATFALTKAFNATSQKLYYQHCPMANNSEGGYWISSVAEIRNPYFGDQMLGCGSTEEELN